MARGRVETTPSEQLVALRQARDRYVALADRLKDNANSIATRLEDRQRERDARRIASAYDKSITNMAAKMVRAGTPSRAQSFFNNLGMARPIFAIAVGLVALAALTSPGIFQSLRASIRTIAPPHAASSRPADQATAAPARFGDSEPNAGKAFVPSHPATSATPHAPTPLRPTAVAERARPVARSANPAHSVVQHKADPDDGFVVKVLQPDGTFKEEFFPARPR